MISRNTFITAVASASRKVGLEIKVEKTKYMLLSHHQNACKNWDKKQQTDCLKMCQNSDILE
jgi:hypothetical protein